MKIGNTVICDLCNKEWTNDNTSGGFHFDGKAICPNCAENTLKSIRKFDEEEYIDSHCPKDKSFADYVREDLRGGMPGEIVVIKTF